MSRDTGNRSATGDIVIAGDTADNGADIRFEDAERRIVCLGDWRVTGLDAVARRAERWRPSSAHTWVIDLGGVEALDTAGALLLRRLCHRAGEDARLANASEHHEALMRLVEVEPLQRVRPMTGNPLERLGRLTVAHLSAGLDALGFIGELMADLVPRLAAPHRLRWRQVAAEAQRAGVNALPITGLLAFLMGVVMAYQGGSVLRTYGANIFIVDLTGITMLREMAPLLVAIIVAGRSGSANAAQIGTMRITEEMDALRTIGVTPFEMLVIPKLLALVICLPLLTVWADGLGVFGGMTVAAGGYGVSFSAFLDRLPAAVPAGMFWAGIVKAPVFALLVGVVGCFQGFRVGGSAEAVGRAATVSVVQAIFLVIVADALFSLAFQQLGI